MNLVDTKCPVCTTELPVPYVELGASRWCNHCLKAVVPAVPLGGSYPLSGSALSFSDFRQLIDESSSRAPASGLLTKWFRYSLSGEGRNVTCILNDRGEAIDPLWLHLKIQADREMQGEIYNLAMSLWR